jgi:1,4-dihydroxy-2-naphthoyl-CoA hydrolase
VEPRSLRATEGTYDALYGLEVLTASDEEARGRVVVGPQHKQGAGLVHGGVLASMAESLTSLATSVAVSGDGKAATGMSTTTTLLRPITGGTVHAVARRRHRGRTTWVWDVDFSDDEGRLCATARLTVKVVRRQSIVANG